VVTWHLLTEEKVLLPETLGIMVVKSHEARVVAKPLEPLIEVRPGREWCWWKRKDLIWVINSPTVVTLLIRSEHQKSWLRLGDQLRLVTGNDAVRTQCLKDAGCRDYRSDDCQEMGST